MTQRNSVFMRLFPLILLLGLGTGSTLGCGGASQSQDTPKNASNIPITDGPASDGFTSTEVSDDSSYLEILADPPTNVLLDGKPIGKTPIKKVQVTPGSHDVTFDDEVGGPRTMSVTVNAGDYQTVKSDRPISLKKQ